MLHRTEHGISVLLIMLLCFLQELKKDVTALKIAFMDQFIFPPQACADVQQKDVLL